MSRRTVHVVPETITYDGSRDVSADLLDWLMNLPDADEGRTWALFQPNGRYRCDLTLHLTDKHGITIDGRGATIFTDSNATGSPTFATDSNGKFVLVSDNTPEVKDPRTRSHVSLVRCQRISAHRLNVRGANINGGVGDAAYVAALEAQHAYNIQLCEDIEITDFEASYVYGDILYAGAGHSAGVYASAFYGHNQGRQGVSICDAHDVIIRDFTLDEIRRTCIDLEPASSSWYVDRVLIERGTFKQHRLNWISSLGAGRVDDIKILDNNVYAPKVTVGISSLRRRNWCLRRNNCTGGVGNPGGIGWHFENIDYLSVTDNVVPLQANRNMALVGVKECTEVRVKDNQYPGGVAELREL